MKNDTKGQLQEVGKQIFKALDKDNKGYLCKSEIIKKFFDVGVLSKTQESKGCTQNFQPLKKVKKLSITISAL